jgi:non-haem Fe2+, alpha-ketoglutarate-dependent halogenase
MPRQLRDAEVERFRRDGILFPIDAFPADEIAEQRRRLEAIEAREGGRLSRATNQKIHLLVPWLWDMVHDARVLDPVEDLLGPDLLCWGSGFFTKGAHDPDYVSWHQDATYWGLSSPDVVTAWVAFTPSVVENGCMRVVPGSHTKQLAHADSFAAGNMLSRGQEVAAKVDEKDAVDVVLKPGQMSLHHVLIIHGSEPNRADFRRAGYAIRYVAGHVRQVVGDRDSATLVRGRDHGHFDLEERPEGEFHPAAVARHTAILKRQEGILYAGAKQVRPFLPAAQM